MRSFQITVVLLIFLVGCSPVTPSHILSAPVQKFSHGDFLLVLERFVDSQGLVDYLGLKNDPQDIERYYSYLASISPDSHPDLFPTKNSKLAYWINGYNAAVIKTVLTYYPIASVKDIRPPLLLFFLPNESGFFLFQRVKFGGQTTSLYYLENKVIRKRFNDPRIHFALNCASLGCPRLPNRPFSAEKLDEELDRETRKFLAEERNLKVDHEAKTILLSSIFEWYEEDFLRWYEEKLPNQKATLLNYVALYVSPDIADKLRASAGSYQVRFIPYDWRLNDKKGAA